MHCSKKGSRVSGRKKARTYAGIGNAWLSLVDILPGLKTGDSYGAQA